MKITLHPELQDLSVIDYLAILWPDRSRRVLQELFAAGRVRSTGHPVGTRRRVGDLADLTLVGSLDDVTRIPVGVPGGAGVEPGSPGSGLEILHEDSRLVTLNKASGVPVVPDRTGAAASCLGYLIQRELDARKSKPPAEYLRYRIVHRIDRLTSGLVIVAKTSSAERRLSADFEERRIAKEYRALLSGVVMPARLRVDCPIVPGRKGKMRAGVTSDLKRQWPERSAVTQFEVLERFGEVTLVRACPETGRTHQIRVHAWAVGYPLAVDPLYGSVGGRWQPESIPGLNRLSLHAFSYTLPETWEEPRRLVCPLASDIAEALERLRG